MRMLLAMLPTLVLVVFSQLATKWRIQTLKTGLAASGAGRLAVYLSDGWIWAAYGAAFLGGIFWMLVIERYALSLAFPVYFALTVLCVAVGSMVLFGEVIRPLHGLGIVLIVTGVALAVHG